MTNGEFLDFVESGGYQNKELWTKEGRCCVYLMLWSWLFDTMSHALQGGSGCSIARPATLHSGCALKAVRVAVGLTLPHTLTVTCRRRRRRMEPMDLRPAAATAAASSSEIERHFIYAIVYMICMSLH